MELPFSNSSLCVCVCVRVRAFKYVCFIFGTSLVGNSYYVGVIDEVERLS